MDFITKPVHYTNTCPAEYVEWNFKVYHKNARIPVFQNYYY